jgi:hypothetical protein
LAMIQRFQQHTEEWTPTLMLENWK